MSRGYDARRKAKRQRARAAAELAKPQSHADRPRSTAILPILVVVAILVATAILGFGAGNSPSRQQIDHEVTALLADIPQQGATLGSPNAPVTLYMYADLECPTVKRFVESYLPSIVTSWVRTGAMKLEYRSLKTDTSNEETFFRQEEAALAAGRQDRLWNFALSFIHQQGERFTEYATESFLTHIASHVPELDMARWNSDRKDISLFKPIAHSVHVARLRGMSFTPSFWISGPGASSMKGEIESSLEKDISALRLEASGDVPILGAS